MNKDIQLLNRKSLHHALESGWVLKTSLAPDTKDIDMDWEPKKEIQNMTLTEVEKFLAEDHDFFLSLDHCTNPPLVIDCDRNNPVNEIETPTSQMGNWVTKFFEMPKDPETIEILKKKGFLLGGNIYLGQGTVSFPPSTAFPTGCKCTWKEGMALHQIPMQEIHFLTALL